MSGKLFDDIEYMKGIGQTKGEKYRKIGITSPYELLFHIPRSYLDFSRYVKISDAVIGENNFLRLTITKKLPMKSVRKGLAVGKAVATDGTDDIILVFYNNVYTYNTLKENSAYYVYGKVNGGFISKEINSPVFMPECERNIIQPVYRLTNGISINVMRNDMKRAVEILENQPFEPLPEHIRNKYNLSNFVWSLKNIHFPENSTSAETARRRLAFDELLKLQLGMFMLKSRTKSHTAFKMKKNTDISDFINSLPFELTDGQKKATAEITADLCRDVPMNRLLQGDVGSGKTAVACVACYFTAKNGIQSALMAPTEILAVQHYNTLCGFLEPFGIRVCLLTGSVTAKKKSEMREKILSGEYNVIVGTHAIIQKDVEYCSLGLVITDEQHRFGVAQRSALAEKGRTPHRLVMSATPIPRTLALMIYGDLDISVIRQLPKGRQPVKTYAVTGKMRHRAFNFVRERLAEGRQAYVVCPMIEESDSELLAVKSYAEKAREADLKGFSAEILHGKMSAGEKDRVMKKFRDGDIDVLICTTVVEVGVDVPNAVVMVIENAERFGLSQIHQLRGRVGRGRFESSCILITDNLSDECRQRMKIMSSTTDGFKISEEDLKMRGPGDFFGNAQHGLPPVKVADISCDMELMQTARQCAEEILADDPFLEKEENIFLKNDIIKLFENNTTG